MSHQFVTRAFLWLAGIPRLLWPTAIFALSFVLHQGTLRGGFVWDDRPAVVDNHDVWIDSPWGGMWRHDFWGQEMTHTGSHKSFRPLTTLSYRLSNIIAQRLSWGEQDGTSGQEESGASSIRRADYLTSKMVSDGRAGVRHTDATGFHLVNILVHAATCSSSVWLFRAIFAGEELPAVMASLLFTVHPVHVEAVAPIVGRADLLCGFLSVMALLLMIGGKIGPPKVSSLINGDGNCCGVANDTEGESTVTAALCRTCPGLTGDEIAPRHSTLAAPADESGNFEQAQTGEGKGRELAATRDEEEQDAASAAAASSAGTSPDEKADASVTNPHGEATRCASGDNGAGRDGREDGVNTTSALARGAPTETAGSTTHAPSSEQCPAVGAMTRPTEGAPPGGRLGAVNVEEEEVEAGPGALGFCAALLLAAGATLCKEVGITVFGLIAGGEVVRFFERHDWRHSQYQRRRRRRRRRQQQQQQQQQQQRGRLRSCSPMSAPLEVVRHPAARSQRRNLFGAAARAISAVICATALAVLHVRLHGGAGVREWGVLENDIAILESDKERLLSYAFTHAVYAYKLVWPTKLCYDWGFSCIPHVTSMVDPAILAPIALYAAILALSVVAVLRRDTAVMWGLALIAVPFLPASNLLFPIGAVVAERLLYLPSVGACVLAGCCLREGGSRSRGSSSSSFGRSRSRDCPTPSPEPGGKKALLGQRQGESLLVPDGDKGRRDATEEEHGGGGSSPLCSGGRIPLPLGCTARSSDSDLQEGSQLFSSCSCSSYSSSFAVRAPTCSSSSALLAAPDDSAWEFRGPPPRVLAPITLQTALRLSHAVMLVILLSWAAFFGAKTVSRCDEWNSEKTLFASALEVCPDGIKTLNNVAVGMLNDEEAGRAERLLRRAVELHQDYAFALFNLGVSLMILEDHIGAVDALERSYQLDPGNTKAMVYLGKSYLELTVKVVENPSALAGWGEGAHLGVGGGRHNSGDDGDDKSVGVLVSHTRPTSPEPLLSAAETYTDRALSAGSGLPLARLVKGRALDMRGQHQKAVEFYQESIDISRHLLSGRSGRSIVGVTGTGAQAPADAIDLASTYNLLGLALRASGTDVVATKEAFLAGLSVAPEDFALLVNGGVAHQTAGDIPGARALYHRALSLQPNSPALLNNVGWLEEHSGAGSPSSLETARMLYARALGLLEAGPSALRRQIELNLENVERRLVDVGAAGTGGEKGSIS